ncbi:hypothetical protein ASF96_08055 [Microbacterium sp. Leaf179]|nr:hypothetical protein ASF96_08055 [Microbacterium sp. Leaf179]
MVVLDAGRKPPLVEDELMTGIEADAGVDENSTTALHGQGQVRPVILSAEHSTDMGGSPS